ncbi:hypothetical protein CsSME_00049840 [Camellia sinensis var. sinensis]
MPRDKHLYKCAHALNSVAAIPRRATVVNCCSQNLEYGCNRASMRNFGPVNRARILGAVNKGSQGGRLG